MLAVMVIAALPGSPEAQAGSLTYSHTSSALPGAAGPAITLLSITGDNDGTNYKFTLTFANPTIEGPSSGKADSVYGFINMDTDNKATTGVTGTALDNGGFEPGFGRYSPSSLGIDAVINLTSEGDPLHGAPGLVDFVSTATLLPIDTVSVTYKNQVGSTPSTLSLSIPLSDFAKLPVSLADTGNFSVVVGNVNNATDFLPSGASVPEPSSIFLLVSGMSVGAMATARFWQGARGVSRSHTITSGRGDLADPSRRATSNPKRPRPARGVRECLSWMRGDSHVQF
jgi:hypothetical protein